MFLESSDAVYQKISDNLGLSEYESKVYVSLVKDGASEAGRLSLRCGVPRTKVYTTLKKLSEKGLIFEIPGSPRRFAPLSPSEAFEQYLANIKEKTSSRVISLIVSKEVVASLEEAYRKTRNNGEPRKENVWIIDGREEVIQKIKEMLVDAKKIVNVIVAEDGFIWLTKTFGKLIDRLAENEVKVSIWTEVNSHNGNLLEEFSYVCKINHIKSSPNHLCISIDNKRFLIAMLNLVDYELQSEDSSALFCNSSAIHSLFSPLFLTLTN
jgi:sugar-specific transcriptional regulator TrmB